MAVVRRFLTRNLSLTSSLLTSALLLLRLLLFPLFLRLLAFSLHFNLLFFWFVLFLAFLFPVAFYFSVCNLKFTFSDISFPFRVVLFSCCVNSVCRTLLLLYFSSHFITSFCIFSLSAIVFFVLHCVTSIF